MQNYYAVFLRAVNVAGKNLIKMAELRDILMQNGFEQVKTYIQSGNLIVSSKLTKDETRQNIQKVISDHFKLSVETFVWDEANLSTALANNPFQDNFSGNRVFITILDKSPKQDRIETLLQMDLGGEQFEIIGDIFYFYLPDGMAKSKISNNFIENKLQVKGTGRNRNTIKRVLDLLREISV